MSDRTVIAHGEPFREPSWLERVRDRLRTPLAALPLRAPLRTAYHRLLLLGTGGKGLAATLPDGEIIRILPEYRYVTWNVAEYEAFTRVLRPGGVALDVGANVGCYAVMFGRRVAPGGRVFAFEPSPDALRGLRRHIALNRLSQIVTAVSSAVADQVGEATLITSGPMGTDHLAPATTGGTDPATVVAVTSLDEFCTRQQLAPDLIKVDVEGAELAVLRGARQTIAANRARLALFVEMHPSLWATLGTSREALVSELDRQALRAEPLRPGDDPWSVEGACVRLVPS